MRAAAFGGPCEGASGSDDQTSKVEVGTGEAGDATQGEAAELLCNSSEIKPRECAGGEPRDVP